MNSRLSILFAAAVCLALAASALAAGPQLINYQGTLTNDQGQPLDGTYNLTFKVYSVVSGGTPLWTQTSASVAVADGLFSVLLGSTAFPAGLFTGADRWLGVTVGAAAELTPRARFTSVPWALRATVADTALVVAGGGGSDGDWTVSGSNMYSAVSGNVGIGTTAPGRKLQVGNNTTLNAEGMIRLGSRSGTNGSNRTWDIGVPETDSDSSGPGYSFVIDDINAGTDPEFMVKFGTGHVGIGTTTPDAPLDIYKSTSSAAESAMRIGTGYQSGIFTVYYLDFNLNEINATRLIGDTSLRLNSTSTGNVLLAEGGGRVGIGTASPGAALDVAGTARVDILEIQGADLAEKFPLSELGEPGTVVVIDADRAGMLRPSVADYDTRVAGVISGAGGLSVGAVLGQCTPEPDAQPIAMSGRVWTRCDASACAIEPGDLLTTSGRPGHAMKAVDPARSHGAVIGKAMTRLARGETGLVLVLINLQ